jgi:hypothetical protein
MMANTISSSMMTHEAPSTTQLGAREVGDEIRYLGVGNAVLTSLVENSIYDSMGKRKTSKGLISKRGVKNVRYEMYTRSNRPYKVTVASGTEVESAGVTLSDANGIQPTMTLYNPATDTRCRVESVASSVVTGTSIGGTFSCSTGDTLVVMAPAQPEGSTASMVVNGSDDNNFNILQFSRWSVSISWVLEAIKQLAGGAKLKREKMYLLWEALADAERCWILGDYTADYATKNTTTGTVTGYTGEFPTTRGLMKLAGVSASAGGAGSLSWLRKTLPTVMSEQTNDNDTFIALCGNEYYGRIVDEMADKHQVDNNGDLKEFGIKSNKIVTAGPTIELVKHHVFNVAGLKNKMLIINPKNIGYVHLDGHDMKPNNGIQTNATHGTQDEVYAYHGIETLDAGKTITLVSNLY